MSAIPVTVQRVVGQAAGSVDELARDLARARTLAWLLDAQFGIGRLRFGLDAVLGLIPVLGDASASLLGLYFVHLAHKHRAPRGTILAMLAVLALDFLLGLTPWLGDLLDAVYKPHLRCLALLERGVAGRA